MEVYACNVKVCDAEELDPPPLQMTKEDLIIAQWNDPDVGKIVKCLNESTLSIVKLCSDTSFEMKQLLNQKKRYELQEGVYNCYTNQSRRNRNEYQLVLSQKYSLEALGSSYDEMGHLGIEHKLALLSDHFLWLNVGHDSPIHYVHCCAMCLKFKVKAYRKHFILSLQPSLWSWPIWTILL